MSESKQIVEGESMTAESRSVSVSLQRKAVPPTRPICKALTLMGAALAFAGREIVPRVAASLLDAWDRRVSGSKPTLGVRGDPSSVDSARQSTARLSGTGGGQYRWRRGRGR
jgi:hypothetical protein